MKNLPVFIGFTVLAAASFAQSAIIPASTGHGNPTFNCATGDTYGDMDLQIVWLCHAPGNNWMTTPAFQPFGQIPSPVTSSIIDKGGQVYDVRAYGAVGNGSHDDTAAIAAAATACGTTNGTLYIPPTSGAFMTSAPVVPPGNCDMRIDGTLKATASMAEVVNIGGNGRAQLGHLYGTGTIDSNNLASRHIYMTNYNVFEISGVTLLNTASIAGIDIGQAGAQSQAGAYIHDMTLWVPVGTAKVSGSVGIWEDTGTDASIGPNIVIAGYDVPVRDSVGGNLPFKDIHVYGTSANNLPTTCFDSVAGNAHWVNDECDTPTAIGIHAHAFNDFVDHYRCYNNSAFGTDNTINCVQFDQGTPNSAVTNSAFQGADSSHRIGTDISASSFANIISTGNQIVANVVNQNSINQNLNNFVVQPAALNINRQGALDVGYSMNLNSGSSAAQNSIINFLDRNTFKWNFGKDASNAFALFDNAQNSNRFRAQGNGGDMTFTNAPGAKFIFAGGILQLAPTGSQPTCALAIEGAFWYTAGTGSTNGILQVCQNQSGTFSWVAH